MQQTEFVILTMGCEKTTNDAIKFSYHFLILDAQPDLGSKMQQTEFVILTMGCEKTTNDAIKFSYHFLILDAQPDFSGYFHQNFLHIAQAR